MNSDKRNDIHQDALTAWIDAGRRGTAELATGLGKTFLALHALHTMPKDDKLHYFLAETRERRKDLLVEINKYDDIFGANTLIDYQLNFECYQTVHKWKDIPNLGLIIADEIHDSLTLEYSNFYQNNDFDAILGLSAKVDVETTYIMQRGVLSYPIKKGVFLKRYAPIIYTYDLNKSRENDISRNLDIHIIYINLNKTEKLIGAGTPKKVFYQTEKDNYRYWDDRFNKADLIENKLKKEFEKRLSSNKRAQLLYNLPSKIEVCKKLLKEVKRVLIFGNSIDALKKITPFVVSSRNSDEHNDFFRNKFEKGDIDNLASFKKLKQGANIKGLDNLIITSYYSTEKDLIQRFGRIRKDGDKKGRVFIFVTKDTQELIWYSKMIANIKTYKIISHANIDHCINYIKNEK